MPVSVASLPAFGLLLCQAACGVIGVLDEALASKDPCPWEALGSQDQFQDQIVSEGFQQSHQIQGCGHATEVQASAPTSNLPAPSEKSMLLMLVCLWVVCSILRLVSGRAQFQSLPGPGELLIC